MAGVATRFLLNRLYDAIRSVSEVIHGELLLRVMDPRLMHHRRDPAREHSGGYIARVGFWLYEF